MTQVIPVRMAIQAMRTRFEIVLWDAFRPDADLRAAGEEALGEIESAERLLSAHDPNALLFALNARLRDACGAFTVDQRLITVLQTALYLCERTGGAFDPTVGNADAVLISRDATGEYTLRTTRPGVRFDAGAIGKGYALDRAADILGETGITNTLLHGGTSSVLARGTQPGGMSWRVAIASPIAGAEPVAVWTLSDGDAVGVSANHTRRHVLNPRTGEPAPSSRLAAVRVIGSATVADALSTALLVVGADGLPVLQAAFPLASDLLVQESF